ncbi:putative GH25 family protein [Polymorphobacter fuscus]|uniref:DUF4198 domain-containing protein n=1 Tax=Sandarakinorhabdus fusca TaxID=1439888 RepID=UPI001430C2E7|nr:DUF4198 domain-containing protein [Polymorphobacter fuscus]NJC08952.1 putative GH25 family protein [Polymorphobacter fuscus]
MINRLALLAAGTLLFAAVPAAAHRQWMLPSATVLSGDDVWVTVDAAISNDLFYFDHQPMRVAGIKAIAPDGSDAAIANASTGRYRSTFDVHLTQKGTYKIENASSFVMGSYMLNGEEKRLPRGTTSATLAAALPAGATNVRTSEAANRNEIFVTVGAPTQAVFKPSGKGIELVPVTHPNDLVAGEAATFQFLLDGAPAAGLGVTVIPGGGRYRAALGQMDLKTDAQGKVVITWPAAGMYWLNASVGGRPEGGPMGAAGPNGPQPGAAAAAGGPAPRRASYVTTLEVLAP